MLGLVRGPVRLLAVAVMVAAATLAATVPGADPAGAVAHGEVVPEGRYRFAVRLTMTGVPALGGLGTWCSGALVARSWIITAGHCFVDPQGRPVSGPVPYPTTATIGTNQVTAASGHRAIVAVTEVQQAPGTDIALGRLARPVGGIDPIALATTAPEPGALVRLVGWGATDSLIPFPSRRLRTGVVEITSVSATTVGVRGHSPAPDTSACLYDSGAPYFTEHAGGALLVAVESDGPPCPHDQEETTARVDTVAGWIRKVIRRER
jgi:secreted trypsin-like serine protease